MTPSESAGWCAVSPLLPARCPRLLAPARACGLPALALAVRDDERSETSDQEEENLDPGLSLRRIVACIFCLLLFPSAFVRLVDACFPPLYYACMSMSSFNAILVPL